MKCIPVMPTADNENATMITTANTTIKWIQCFSKMIFFSDADILAAISDEEFTTGNTRIVQVLFAERYEYYINVIQISDYKIYMKRCLIGLTKRRTRNEIGGTSSNSRWDKLYSLRSNTIVKGIDFTCSQKSWIKYHGKM